MKKMRYVVCDCEHDGDIEAGEDVVARALTKIGSKGKIINTRWSGEDGDNAYVIFEVEEDKANEVNAAIESILDGDED